MNKKFPFKDNMCVICIHYHWRVEPDYGINHCRLPISDRKDQCDCTKEQFRPKDNLEWLEYKYGQTTK